MQDHDPTVRSRELGRLLSEAMKAIGMTQNALADELDWSASTVSRMITGKRPVGAEQMSGVLGVLRVTGEKRRYAMAIARRATDLGWLRELGDRRPARNEPQKGGSPDNCASGDEIPCVGDFPASENLACDTSGRETLAALEDAAAAVVMFEPNCVPDVLQTVEYMTALHKAGAAFLVDEINARVSARLARHGDFIDRKGPANLLFFIDEYALCRTGAGREVMSIQVHHLLRTAVRPGIAVRVIPESAGFHAGAKGGFQLMTFKDDNSVVCVENETSIAFLEREESITAYENITTELSRVALSETTSRTWLSALADRLGVDLSGELE